MRETTERPEAVSSGLVKLVGTDFQQIVNMASELEQNDSKDSFIKAVNPYGDGKGRRKNTGLPC